MGIKNLMQLIKDNAPDAIKRLDISTYMGRAIACDASMAIYQFLIATIQANQSYLSVLQDEEGNPTGHLVGLWNRTISLIENGIQPIWVFDGKPPELKAETLNKRKKRKQEAAQKLEIAIEEGDVEEQRKQAGRSVHITTEMINDAKHMLRMMGVSVVEAPGEAEAQCAAYVKEGKAYATASEDLDTLTFASKFLLRGFNNKKEPIIQVSYDQVINDLQLTHNEFVDMCILCGCDYTNTIEGIGPKTAYKLIKENRSIEQVIIALEEKNKKKKKQIIIPEDFDFQTARLMFLSPNVDPNIPIQFKMCEAEDLEAFLVQKKQFDVERVRSGIKKILDCYSKPKQSKIDSFFKPLQQNSGKRQLAQISENPTKKMKSSKSKKK